MLLAAKPLITLIRHNEFIAKVPSTFSFWIDQIIPEEGIVLLWGPTSVGKSPVSWNMATAIANGTPFFGYTTKLGRVLYLEVDTPEALVHQRAHFLSPSDNLLWAFSSALHPGTGAWKELREQTADFLPEVVFVNTLRKAHGFPDRDSEVPSKVYSAYQSLFPGAALVFIHHARKLPQDAGSTAPAGEGFSGSQAWQNDAQVALHLHTGTITQPNEGEGAYIQLDITKSQVSAKAEALDLFLAPDGYTLTGRNRTSVRQYLCAHPKATLPQVAAACSVSLSTVERVKRTLKNEGIP